MLVRFFERELGLKKFDQNEDFDLFWTKEKAFMNKTCDFHIDSDSGVPLKVEAERTSEIIEQNVDRQDEDIVKPSLLEENSQKMTTADFFLPTVQVHSNTDNRIYGAYYLTQ